MTTFFAESVIGLPRFFKRMLVLVCDVCLCLITVWFGYYLRLGEWGIPVSGYKVIWVSVALAIPLFYCFGLYREIFRYSGWPALISLGKVIAIYALIFFCIFTAYGFEGIPRTIGLIQPILLLLFVAASRSIASLWLGSSYRKTLNLDINSRVLIYGAGALSRELAGLFAAKGGRRVLGFISRDQQMVGNYLYGIKVYCEHDLLKVIEKLKITDVLLADPSMDGIVRHSILKQLLKVQVSVRTVPNFSYLAKGSISESDIQELDLNDLLGRAPVNPFPNLMYQHLSDKVLLITGAGGSIGSEICRQAILCNPKRIVLVDQSEFALYQIHQELAATLSRMEDIKIELTPLLASIQNQQRMNEIFSAWKPEIVFHAAAYKHVPIVEHNPIEGLLNNVYGTWSIARIAIKNGVNNFVLISTDKAVRPTNIMGASKRLAEMILQSYADKKSEHKTLFSMVRFGNVLGSSGSVVPKFREQIRAGGPLTITHPEITRYFMSVSEAAQLVIQASALANGGDVFLLDMGEPVRIIDLAHRIVMLSGLRVRENPNGVGDIEIKITGLRPGEKLYEELLIGDNPEVTIHPRIMKSNEDLIPYDNLERELKKLQEFIDQRDFNGIESFLVKFVSGYQANFSCVDWVYIQKGTK
jgi:FlaA1/EpsC-like NDP-sugar epimerase